MTNSPDPRLGLSLHIYPSTLLNASRIFRMTQSLQAGVGFAETHAVGIGTPDLPQEEPIGDGVRLVRVSGHTGGGVFGRILKVLTWQPRVFRQYRDLPIALVAAHNVWVLPLSYRLAQVTGARFVYNPHELETETVTMRGLKKKLAQVIEARYVPRADLCSTVNESIASWYQARYVIDRPLAIYNIPTVKNRPAAPRLRDRLGLNDEAILFVHTGSLAPGRNVSSILDAFAAVPDKHVVFIGDGAYLADVQAGASQHPNIHWIPPVASTDVVAYVSEADFGLCIIDTTSESLRLSTPNKLFEALASSTPVIATELPEVRQILGALAPSWIVPDAQTSLRNKISSLSREDAASFAQEWTGVGTWDEQVAPLVTAYRNLTSAPR